MDISINTNERLFNTELESHVSRLILNDKIGVIVHGILAVVFMNIGEFRLTAVSIVFILYSMFNFTKNRAFKTKLTNGSMDVVRKVSEWKTFHKNNRKYAQVVFMISVPVLILFNFLSGMTISEMLTDSYTFILVPSFIFISLLYFTKGFPALPFTLEKEL